MNTKGIYQPDIKKAIELFQMGTLALIDAEQQGIKIDVKYIHKQNKKITKKIKNLEKDFLNTKLYAEWKSSTTKPINIYSNPQLGKFLYSFKKIKQTKLTDKGNLSTDDEALSNLKIPELEILSNIKKLKKLRDTYLSGILREQVDGVLHPFFNLNVAVTYRSCIAKGTSILTVKNTRKRNIKIEDIKVGDFVYCFDDNLNPTIQKVLWAGKTGHKKVIRIHWTKKFSKKTGYLDVTPEHKIRLTNGEYVGICYWKSHYL